MTRLPAETWNVQGRSGLAFPAYKVGPLCSAPGCSRIADHVHHIWRRSFTGGDHPWVELLDTHTIVGNLTGLCWRHHTEITENRSRIMWDQRMRLFYWCDVRTDNNAQISAAIFPQPPIHGTVAEIGDTVQPDGPAAVPLCPGCHRPLPTQTERKLEKARRRKTWTVTVPADSDEDGALVLDTLLESCRSMFGHEQGLKMRYFTLVQALALVVQNEHVITTDKQTDRVNP